MNCYHKHCFLIQNNIGDTWLLPKTNNTLYSKLQQQKEKKNIKLGHEDELLGSNKLKLYTSKSPSTKKTHFKNHTDFYNMVLFLRLAVASVSELKMESPTSVLQSGQDALIFSHLSTQSLWKKWEQGNSLSSSLFAYFAKQIQQTCGSE